MLRTLLIIGAGSFIGGIVRFLLTRLEQSNVHSVFPWGTLAVNVAGCLFIGILYGLFERGNLMDQQLRLFLTIGFEFPYAVGAELSAVFCVCCPEPCTGASGGISGASSGAGGVTN